MSLVDIMVGLAISIIVALAVNSMFTTSQNGIFAFQSMVNVAKLHSMINSLVAYERICVQVFGDGVSNPVWTVPSLTASSPITLYNYPPPPGGGVWLQDPTLGSATLFEGTRIIGLQFVPETQVPTPDSAGTTVYLLGQIQVTTQAPASKAPLIEKIPMMLKLDSANRLVGCSGVNPDSLRPIPLPVCTPGQIMLMDGTTHKWSCGSVL